MMIDPTQSDHDLLVALNTKFDIWIARSNDHEVRLRDLEARPDPSGLPERVRSLELTKAKALGFMLATNTGLTILIASVVHFTHF